MTLKQYANKLGVHYRTAWNYFKQGLIPGAYQISTGTIIVPNKEKSKIDCTIIYSRVSSSQNKSNLDSQANRLVQYCTAKGYGIDKIIKEIGSGINDKRPKLLQLLTDKNVTLIVIEHKDRLTRFGFNYIEKLLAIQDVKIEIVNNATTDKEDLMQDFVSIITSFVARLYGQRRSKRKTELLIKELEHDKKINNKS